jgi:two-component system LytT family response regulator
MIIKAIIVDDDLKSRELIHSFCRTYSDDKIQILELCNSVDTAIVAIEKHNPDLIFLDIDMPEKNGFELVNHFIDRSFEIVFVTGHKNHQTEAIACSAMNYLMKPINPLSLKSIIDQFEFKKIQKNSLNRLEILKNNLRNEQKSIAFSDKDGFKVTLVSDIIYCETGNGDGKCTIVTTKETIVNSKSLKQMVQLLPETLFLKVSASAIVNKNFAKSFNTKKFELEMTSGKNIKVSDDLFNKSTLMDALKH